MTMHRASEYPSSRRENSRTEEKNQPDGAQRPSVNVNVREEIRALDTVVSITAISARIDYIVQSVSVSGHGTTRLMEKRN